MIDCLRHWIRFLGSKQSVANPVAAVACVGLPWLALGYFLHIDTGLGDIAGIALVTSAVGLGVDTRSWRLWSSLCLNVIVAAVFAVALAVVQQFEYARLGKLEPLTIRTALELFVPLFSVIAMSAGWLARKRAQTAYVEGTAFFDKK